MSDIKEFLHHAKIISDLSLSIINIINKQNSNVDNSCKICFDSQISHTFNPCGHTVCENCSKLSICPFCRINIVSVIKLFF